MKTPTVFIPVPRDEYRIFVSAARLVRRERPADAPDGTGLILFQLQHRTAAGIAKDYLDFIGDFSARRRIKIRIPRRLPDPTGGTKTGRRFPSLKLLRVSGDPTRN